MVDFSVETRNLARADRIESDGWGRGCEVEKGPGGIEADNAYRVAISRDTSHHQHINRAPGLSGCAVIFCGRLRVDRVAQFRFHARHFPPAPCHLYCPQIYSAPSSHDLTRKRNFSFSPFS